MRRIILVGLVLVAGTATARSKSIFFGFQGEVDKAELPRASVNDLRDECKRQGCDDPDAMIMRHVPVQPRRAFAFRPWLTGASVAVDAASGDVFVADTENDAISVSDAEGKKLLRTIDVGRAPEQVIVAPDGRAFVTVRNTGEVVSIAAGASTVEKRVHIGVEPFGLALSADGKTLYASVVRSSEIVALDAASLQQKWRVGVDSEPRALAAAVDGDKLFVSHLIGRSVSVVDLGSAAHVVRRIPLAGAQQSSLQRATGRGGRVPNLAFAMALSPGGRRLYVPHVLEDSGQNVEPQVRSGGYGAGTADPIVATVTTIDADSEELISEGDADQRASFGFALRSFFSQPRAVVIDPRSSRMYVAAMGTDGIRVLNTAVKDPSQSPGLPAAQLGGNLGLKGLAISKDGKRLYAHASLKHEVRVFDIARMQQQPIEVAHLTVGPERLPPEAVRGRALFFTATDPHVSRMGQFACASCHPEGKQDGMTWRLDKGPRQTPVLAGRLTDTAPFNWLGTKGSLQDNMKDTMGRLGGAGITKKDLAALELYLTKYLDAGPAAGAPTLTAAQARGKHLFESAEVGCANCHSSQAGARFTDGKNHDIGTTTPEEVAHLLIDQGHKAPADKANAAATLVAEGLRNMSTVGFLRVFSGRPVIEQEDMQAVAFAAVMAATPALDAQQRMFARRLAFSTGTPSRRRLPFGGLRSLFALEAPQKKKPVEKPVVRLAYNTPSLIGVAQSGPYLHDGSAPTLRELLTSGNAGDRMGRTSHLSSGDVDALVAYLETL
jgi:YVTN family beta-propeller protein